MARTRSGGSAGNAPGYLTLLKHDGAGALRAEDVEAPTISVPRRRVRAHLGRHDLLGSQARRADDLDDARLADRDVDALDRRVVPDHVGHALEPRVADDLARRAPQRHQN